MWASRGEGGVGGCAGGAGGDRDEPRSVCGAYATRVIMAVPDNWLPSRVPVKFTVASATTLTPCCRRTRTDDAFPRSPKRGLPLIVAKPPNVSFPPPDSAVRLRTDAVFPVNTITPFAFEIPFGNPVEFTDPL